MTQQPQGGQGSNQPPVPQQGQPAPVPGQIVTVQQTVQGFTGPYDGITDAHMEMQAWIREQGRAVQGTSIEEYVSDPGENPDPSTWQTRISYPLA